METTMAVACLLLLVGSAAAFPDGAMAREDFGCREGFFPTDIYTDFEIERCLRSPNIAAVADGFTGAEADKRIEIKLQCDVEQEGLFTGGALDPDLVKQYFERGVKAQGYGASVMQGLDDCSSILQEPYQLLAYMRCVGDYC